MLHRAVALAVVTGAVACTAPVRVAERSPVDPAAGRIAVYMDPMGPEAARLHLGIAAIDAVRDDGGLIPIPLLLEVLPPDGQQARERLVAAGALPAGRYQGLSILISKASVTNEEGTAALRVPEEARRIAIPFALPARGGVVLSMSIDLRAAIAAGFRFDPLFVARTPPRPPIGLVGYAVLPGEGALLAFNKQTGKVFGLTPVGRRPSGLAMDPSRRRIYVVLKEDEALAVVDMEQGAVVDRRPLRGGDAPSDLALTPDGRRLVVANEGSSIVSLIDTEGLVEVARLTVGDGPRSVLIDRAGRRAYVPCVRANRVDVIDLERGATTGSIQTDPRPLRAQLNRQETRLFVIHGGSPQLAVADPKTLTLLQRIYVGSEQEAIKIDSRTDRLYLARVGVGSIEVFDPRSLLAVDRLTTACTPVYLTIDQDTGNLVAALPETREVRMTGLVSRTTVAVVDAGFEVGLLALAGER